MRKSIGQWAIGSGRPEGQERKGEISHIQFEMTREGLK
jgi:hypothetical protein